MKHLYKSPNVVKIVWYHQEHTCEDDTMADGTRDCDFQSCKSQYTSCISPILKAWI